MPLPWKKTRVARISRLVADLQSPKHGNSLVVETGFPTSLVDLFVKNRDRLKKKKKRAPASDVSAVDTVIVPPSPPPPPQPAVFESHSVIEGESLRGEQKENLEESLLEREDKIQIEDRASGCDRRWLFATGLKMFVVMVLALSTKKLTVGITASAFLLLFLEYFGKHIVWFLKPCLRSNRIDQCKDFKTPIANDFKAPIVKEDRIAVLTIGGLESSEEIQVVEPNFGVATQVEEIRIKEPDLKLMDYLESERDVEGDQDRCVLVLNKEGSRRAKLKAKIKKIVPKKLRHGKREKKRDEREPESSCSEVCSSFDGEVEEPEIGDKQVSRVQGESKLSPLEEKEEEKCTRKLDDRFHSLNIQLQTIGEKGVVEEKLGIEKKGNSGYLLIFLIVLSGLIGGRVVAVLLTVSGCVMTKLVRSSVSSSSWNLGWW
ncbi:ethylene-responsive nuclear family protein [Tripterygium wilfordii]|uniref:Ethylene-responsive nuclear family protein n=1 Tax=Tripterygium wilfordii TaxID=458696 RepID=A0A7J7C538_TRIWF|nr:uncharacterized protein LOC119989672 [Tripterygium wilfordii]KAF5729270.1 ethylene-responsive nuclear family protein [Tripterygium wilfordii]